MIRPSSSSWEFQAPARAPLPRCSPIACIGFMRRATGSIRPRMSKRCTVGEPLTDEDRWPWLHGIAAWIDATRRVGNHGTAACSALKRAYRDILVGERPDVRIVYIKGERDLIARRLAAR